ncbi:hypothetical protein V495_07079, partial [Pseudogymnoascus sp. VKM F-4514 (FW-929)]
FTLEAVGDDVVIRR